MLSSRWGRISSLRSEVLCAMAKISYLTRSLASQFSKVRFMCPNCGADAPRNSLDRKYVFTQLRRCSNCKMMFRTPTDDPADNASFYESEYTQGFTTELPSDPSLSELKRTNFAGTEKDYSYYIAVLAKTGLGAWQSNLRLRMLLGLWQLPASAGRL